MKKKGPTNLPASVRDRLLKIAKERGDVFQTLLINYALERWLYRLSQSPHRNRFVLKGAMLFALWTDEPHRSTQDLDLLGYGGNSITEMEQVIREVCAVECADDGLDMLPESVKGGLIREDRKYEGVRINLLAMLGKARIPLQIDVGFGDVVVPAPAEIEYPTLLELPAPRLRVYRRETVVAEKFHAMVERGIGNSRMKDYFDLWVLAESFEFDGATLAEAIRAVFERRQTPLPGAVPVGLSEAFGNHAEKLAQWRAFVRRGNLKAGDVSLPVVVVRVRDFLMPVVVGIAADFPPSGKWKPEEGEWK
ncbi:MAG: nucleotidyl transferase AbiEii/AbiGii toxin family protein [Acidobacteria bacterium]|nr:nucleotidyl transferase AbiEii/AbiGii toxin family protein [Acidobacteriota bacterium]